MSRYAFQSSGTNSTQFGRSAGPYLLILPTLVLTFWVIGYPLWDLVNMSTHTVTRFGQLKGFVGVANFANLIAEPLFRGCLVRTLIWTISVAGGSVIFSMPIALILNEKFAGRRLARVIIMLPWAVSLTMTGIVWRWAMDGQSGMVNATLLNLGAIRHPIAWLATGGTAFPVEIVIGILVSIPFSVTVFLGGLASVPSELYEAARIDGATAWQCWLYLTLPLLRPFINIALVLNVIYVFNSFPLIWVMTQGDPANSTDIFVTWLYKLAFRYGKLDSAAALSLVMFVILLAFTITYALLAMREESVEEGRK